MLTIEEGKDEIVGHCDCCGRATRLVRGFVYSDGAAHAVYLARWSEGHPGSGAEMLVSVGDWDEGSDALTRRAVVLEWQPLPDRPGCRAVDAGTTVWAKETSLFGRMLSRRDALEPSISAQVFAIADVVYQNDARFREFIGGIQDDS